MSEPLLLIDNSFSRIIDFPPALLAEVKAALTYKDLEAEQERVRLYMMMKHAHVRGNKPMFYALRAQINALPPTIVCWLDVDRFCTGHLDMVRAIIDKAEV